MAQIICKNAELGYDGRTVVRNIDLEVNEGDYLSVVGENGSGKSTLIKALLGRVQPISGSIELSEDCGRGKVGYLPQQTDVQRDFPASVEEVVRSGCVGSGLFIGREGKARAQMNIQRLGLAEIAKKSYRELSGGQQQRVLLCRALCAAKKLLLLDEPVTGLDPAVTEEMYELISTLNKEGMTVIMVTHDIPAAIKYSSHILHIAHEPLFFGKTEDYLESDAGRIYAAKEVRV